MSYGLWHLRRSMGRSSALHASGTFGGARVVRRDDSQRCERAAREHLLASGHALHHRPYPCAQSHPIHERAPKRGEIESARQYHAHGGDRGGKLPYINTKDDIQQRASLILIDVRYVIEAHFDLTDKATPDDNAGKFKDIIRRRLERGQCYSMPYFGTREFPAHFKACEEVPSSCGFYADESERDLGFMLYDMDYRDPKNIAPMFFRAVMRNGVIDVAGSEVFR